MKFLEDANLSRSELRARGRIYRELSEGVAYAEGGDTAMANIIYNSVRRKVLGKEYNEQLKEALNRLKDAIDGAAARKPAES